MMIIAAHFVRIFPRLLCCSDNDPFSSPSLLLNPNQSGKQKKVREEKKKKSNFRSSAAIGKKNHKDFF
jgi:hypothetical protein